MTKNSSSSPDQVLADELQIFVQRMLDEGFHPVDVTRALTNAAIHIGLNLAPNAGMAFAVVMKAAGDATADWACAQNSQDPDMPRFTAASSASVH